MASSDQELELLSRRLHQAHRSAIQAGLAAAGLGEVGHPMLLSILERSSGCAGHASCAQRDLAQMLHISPAAVAGSLKSLERGGYIRRQPRPGDARCNLVALTEKGGAAVEGCHLVFARVAQRMLDGFSEEELRQLMDFQYRMLHNLSEGRESQAAFPACARGPQDKKED